MTDFIYTDNIPAASHNPSADQPIMQINTNSIDGIIAVDHFSFNDPNGGWHKQSTYVNETAPTTLPGQLALYSKGPAGGPSELFMIRDGNAGTETQLSTSAVGTAVRAQTGYSWLPGGLLIQWGQTVVVPGTTTVISFLQPFATVGGFLPVVVATGLASASNQGIGIGIGTITTTGFRVNNQIGVNNTINWHAIGPI
jgi:hypothetical protein